MSILHPKHSESDWGVVITITVASVFLAAVFHWQPSENRPSFLHREGATLQLVAGQQVLNFGESAVYIAGDGQLLSIHFTGAAGVIPEVIGHDPDAGQLSHALGQVRYSQLWPGVDLVYEQTSDRVIEATWYIAPGAAPEQIQFGYDTAVEVDERGQLVIKSRGGRASRYRAEAWQQVNGHRREVEVSYHIKRASAERTLLSFNVGHYESASSLFIDPAAL